MIWILLIPTEYTYELLDNKTVSICIHSKSCPPHIQICTTESCIYWWFEVFSKPKNIMNPKKKKEIKIMLSAHLIIKIAISLFERYFADSIFTNHNRRYYGYGHIASRLGNCCFIGILWKIFGTMYQNSNTIIRFYKWLILFGRHIQHNVQTNILSSARYPIHGIVYSVFDKIIFYITRNKIEKQINLLSIVSLRQTQTPTISLSQTILCNWTNNKILQHFSIHERVYGTVAFYPAMYIEWSCHRTVASIRALSLPLYNCSQIIFPVRQWTDHYQYIRGKLAWPIAIKIRWFVCQFDHSVS